MIADRPVASCASGCPLMFGHMALGGIGAGYARRFPEVQLEVTVEDRQVDLIEEGYVVVIRVNLRRGIAVELAEPCHT